ncbi:endopeptidase La [Halobacteriovorax sp. GB3]|uniref:endopeptidase La n=1 Tax=Halobacteriovorax sp. GB3 TaxID=2719615 RepID=UPI00235E4EA4|nr:endopeptidase La [Halobacteriovorax sp. GB3]MDD0853790.1 endopeptidase La [Halobacteriovorax sp. GB3]
MADSRSEASKKFPLLPLRDVIIFPHMVVPLFVGREKSIAALEEASKNNNELFLVTQRDPNILNPDREDLYNVGTVVNIIQMLRLPDNTVKVLIEGKYRAKIDSFHASSDGYWAEVSKCVPEQSNPVNIEATMRSIKSVFEQYVKLNKRIPPELLMSISSITDASRLADIIVAHLNMKIPEKQQILEAVEIEARLKLLLEKMQGEIEIINVERRIRTRVKSQMEKSQKEYYLNEQMNAIQKELGQKDDKTELQEMEEKLAKKNMPEEARAKTEKELKKLKSMSPMSAEAAVVRNYVDWMLSLPWGEYTEDNNNINHAREILDEHHFGMKDVKDRIVEYLAVRSLVGTEGKGTLLCLAGPPGVGKTSIARSLAESLGREFQRISLGGVRDESEIRGHRRTYVGAMPGKIINALKKAGTSNPVILLDEIDKMTSDMRGDPSAAMLEVLDPEQNKNFGDHYIEVEYDLSKVMFIMTANDLSKVPGPLRDRMEIISLSGYTPDEKLQIGKRYLLERAKKNNGLFNYDVTMNDKTMLEVVRGYTKEAGVREFERLLNTVARKIATDVVSKDIEEGRKFNVSSKQLPKLLGPKRFEGTGIEQEPQVGLVNGLAYTSVGGELLHIEVVTVPGNGKIQITGKLGEVMQESAKAALSYVRSVSARLGISSEWYDKNDIHIHVPEGATPKDGPSAGVTMTTALTSAITGIPVWQNVAMTGEVTIRGRVLPIGGLKEKLLAAKQAGVTKVVIPKKNEKDLADIPSEIKSGLDIYPVESAEEVLKLALQLQEPEKFLQHVGLTVIETDSSTMEVAN